MKPILLPAFCLLAFCPRLALAAPSIYDPSLGTLPDAQGFIRQQNPIGQIEPTIVDGTLRQGLTFFDGIQCWNGVGSVVDFNGAVPFELIARLKVQTSTFISDIGDQTHRYGYYIWMSAGDGRRLALGISSFSVAFDTQFKLGDTNPAPVGLDTSSFRTYRVLAGDGRAKLFVDGILKIDAPLGPPDVDIARNEVFFGDYTFAGQSQTELAFIRFGPRCPCDLNGDGLVDDSDFTIFVRAYDTLDCTDSTMPAGCPSDFNGDAVVDDTDFQVFVLAYNELVCP